MVLRYVLSYVRSLTYHLSLFCCFSAKREVQPCCDDHDRAAADGEDRRTDAAGGGKRVQCRVDNSCATIYSEITFHIISGYQNRFSIYRLYCRCPCRNHCTCQRICSIIQRISVRSLRLCYPVFFLSIQTGKWSEPLSDHHCKLLPVHCLQPLHKP